MKPVSYYHVWVGEGSLWYVPAREHFTLLNEARFDGEVRIGIVGPLAERAKALHWIESWWPEVKLAAVADEGYEQVTINVMHAWSKTADPATPVYYSHTKGALNYSPFHTAWRRSMECLTTDWEQCTEDLKTYDAVGLHWLTSQEFFGFIDPKKPMFGGNYWWTTAGYLAKLERVRGTVEFPPVNRYEAEGWMGQGFPRVKDLRPGWPQYV